MNEKPLSLQEQLCPPHDFKAGWIDNDHGALYCRFCGDVRALTPQTTPAPAEESIKSREDGK